MKFSLLPINCSLTRGMLDLNHQRQTTMKGNTVSFTSAEEVITQCDYYMMKKRGKTILPIRTRSTVNTTCIHIYICSSKSLIYFIHLFKWGIPWTGHRSIAGLTERYRQPLVLMFRLLANLKSIT